MLSELIDEGQKLQTYENFNTSKLTVWALKCKRKLEELYDKEIATTFDHIVSGGAVIRMGASDMELFEDTYKPKIKRGVEFLEAMNEDEMPSKVTDAGANVESPKSMSVVNGTVIMGNNNTVTNVTIKAMLEALEKEVEQSNAPKEEKKKVTNAIKSITTNPALLTILGQSLGAFLSHHGG